MVEGFMYRISYLSEIPIHLDSVMMVFMMSQANVHLKGAKVIFIYLFIWLFLFIYPEGSEWLHQAQWWDQLY